MSIKVVGSFLTLLKLWRIVAQFAGYHLMAGSEMQPTATLIGATSRMDEDVRIAGTGGENLLTGAHQAKTQLRYLAFRRDEGADAGRHRILFVGRVPFVTRAA